MSITQERRPGEIAWSLYDVANSAFATTVMAAFFPVFLKEYWARDTNIVSDPFPPPVPFLEGVCLVRATRNVGNT